MRSFHGEIHVTIASKFSHQNLTGLALTGMIVTFYVLGFDMAAISFAALQMSLDTDSFDFITLIFLTAYSGLSYVLPGLILFYLFCKHVHEYNNDNGSAGEDQSRGVDDANQSGGGNGDLSEGVDDGNQSRSVGGDQSEGVDEEKKHDCCAEFCITKCLPAASTCHSILFLGNAHSKICGRMYQMMM